MSGKCGKQARRRESGVKSHYEAEHRSAPARPPLSSLLVRSVWTLPSRRDSGFNFERRFVLDGWSYSERLRRLPRVTFRCLPVFK